MEPKTAPINLKFLVKAPKRQKTVFEIMKIEAKQFCLNTALHGYRFIVLPKRTLLERVIWVIVCLASLIVALTLLFMAWFNFRDNPIGVVTDSTHYPVWNYPFPAVTLCNFNKISRKRAFQLAKALTVTDGRSSEEVAWDLRLLSQLINTNNPNIPQKNYTSVHNLLKRNNISVNTVIQQLSPTCEEILQRCKWKGEEKRCENMFETVRTSEGFCCTFNYYASKSHTFSGTFSKKAPTEARRVSACGHQTALEILVDSKPGDYFASFIPSFGFRVFVHNPYYFPDWTLQNMLVEMNIISLISVNPTATYSSDSIRKMDINTRHCLFYDERTLKNFNGYNFHNCMAECRMNLTMRLCGCKPYYHFNNEDSDENMCTLQDVPCLTENEGLIKSSVPGFNFSSIEKQQNHVYGSEKGECDCLIDCEVVTYLSESSSGVLNSEYSMNEVTMFGGFTIKNQSVIKVFFNDLVGIKNRRDVVFSWHTLLAYYGGLLGFFIGFSFVSGMEILYFFIIRLLSDIAKYNKVTIKAQKINVDNPKINIYPSKFENLDPRTLIVPAPTVTNRRNYFKPYIE